VSTSGLPAWRWPQGGANLLPMGPRSLGLLLMGAGVVLALVGLVAYYGGLSWFGRLPGDIRYESDSTRIFVPITSMILVSIVLTLLVNLLRRLF